jgi:DNA-binding NarL/FixJ family response regulator
MRFAPPEEATAELEMTIRVLVLEPDEPLLESFRTYFERVPDFRVHYTSSGEECISLLHSFCPHVLLMEPALPGGVADRILDAIGDDGRRMFVPVLVLTRFSSREPVHPMVKEFLVKPQSLGRITDAIRRLADQGAGSVAKQPLQP